MPGSPRQTELEEEERGHLALSGPRCFLVSALSILFPILLGRGGQARAVSSSGGAWPLGLPTATGTGCHCTEGLQL